MAITRNISILGKEVPFKASAATPRIYRQEHGRDIFADLNRLADAISKSDTEESTLDTFSLELFENIAYTMARQADPSVPNTVDAWLDQFDTFSIYLILPQLIELWRLNTQTTVDSKKNIVQLNGL